MKRLGSVALLLALVACTEQDANSTAEGLAEGILDFFLITLRRRR